MLELQLMLNTAKRNILCYFCWISDNVLCATSKCSDQPAHTRSLIRAFASRLNIRLLTEHHLEFLNLNGGCTCLSESIHVKILHCWKSHVAAQFSNICSLP